MRDSSGGDLAPSLGDGKNFRGPKFLYDFFFEIPIFRAKISDDLFSGFSLDFPYLYYVKCRISPFPHMKNTFLLTLFVLSRASDNTTSQNIVGGRMHGPSPPQTLGGPSPKSL